MPKLPAPLSGEAEEARTRLFEALCHLVLGISPRCAPVVFIMDDAHWADVTTLEWLGYLGNWLVQGNRGGILLIGTCRQPEERDNPLFSLRGELKRLGILSELLLRPLEVRDVHEAFQRLMGSSVAEKEVAAYLHELTDGNPFYLTEILQSFIQNSGHYPKNPADLDGFVLPLTVRETIHQRLSNLSPLERQILEAVAILETVSSLDILRLTSGRNEWEALESLEKLVDHHLLEERDGGYRFHHELVRTTLEGELSQWRRQLLHRRAGKALEKIQPDQVAALSWHFEQGGQTLKAAAYARQAGLNAAAVFAYPEALAAYSRALTLLRKVADTLKAPEQIIHDQHQQLEVLSARSWLCRLLGQFDACRQDLEEQARLARSLKDWRILADVLASEVYLHRRLGHLDRALTTGYESLDLAQQVADPYIEARAYREIGITLRAKGDFILSRQMLERASERFAEMGNDILLVHTLGNLSTLRELAGDADGAAGYARQALQICEKLNLTHIRRIPLGDLGVALARLDNEEQGCEALQQSLALARLVGDRAQEIFCLDRLGWLFIKANRSDEALEFLHASLSLAEEIESRLDQSHIHLGLAEAYCLSGENHSAKTHALQGYELAKEIGQAYELGIAQRILAKLESECL